MNKSQTDRLSRYAVAALIAVYIALATTYAIVERPRFGPDESAHFLYIRAIGSHFRLPQLAHEETNSVLGWEHEKFERRLPVASSHEAHQPPLYYTIEAVPYYILASTGASTDAIWKILRIFTVVFGAGWVYCLYRLSREIFSGSRWPAVLAAGFVGLLPMSVYIGGVVNNDAIACLSFTAGLWLILKCVRRGGIDTRSAVTIGIVTGLAILSKAQGALLIPTLAAAALVIARHRQYNNAGNLAKRTIYSAIIGLAIGSIWFIRNLVAYGTPMVQSLVNPAHTLSLWLFNDQLFEYFWTPFWLIQYAVDEVGYNLTLRAFCLVLIVGVITHLKRSRKANRRGLSSRADVWMLLLVPGLLIYVFLLRHTFLVDKGALQQGRLMLPAAGVLGAAFVACFSEVVKHPKVRVLMGLIAILGLIVANLAVMACIPSS